MKKGAVLLKFLKYILILFLVLHSATTVSRNNLFGQVLEVISGEGGYNSIIMIDIGSNENVCIANKGWVSNDNGKTIAFFEITEVYQEYALARIFEFSGSENLNVRLGMKVIIPENELPLSDAYNKSDDYSVNLEEIIRYKTEVNINNVDINNKNASGYMFLNGDSYEWFIDTNQWEMEIFLSSDSKNIWLKVLDGDKKKILGDFQLYKYSSVNLIGGGRFYFKVYSKNGEGFWKMYW